MASYGTHRQLTNRFLPFATCASLFAAALVACSSDEGSSGGGGDSSGGTTSTGGDGQPGSGGDGNPATGGDGDPGSGGDGNPGAGGSGGGGGDGTMGGVVPGTDHYDCGAPTGTLPSLKLVEYATGFDSPVLVTHAPNDTERLFVVEQPGVIRVVKNGTTNASPFLDISDRVSFGGNTGGTTWEQGLLGLAFHPDYDENGLFYVHYNSSGVTGHPNGSAIIAEFKVSADPDVADGGSERIVLGAPTTTGFHNGGTITFGPDGMLYIALGDGGSEPNGQDVTNVRAGISRIDPVQSGADPYTVPAGNLKESVPSAAPELWSYGLRNPYRFNFDACTGDMYIGDVGQSTWEEINVEPAGEGHRNYGWATMEGPDCYQPASGCDQSGITLPTVSYDRPAPQEFRSVTGGAVYRGSAIPALRGTYFYSDLYIGTSKFVYDPATGDVSDHVSVEDQLNPAQTDQALVAIQTGGDGELYFVSRGGTNTNPGQVPPGVVYRLEADQ